MPITPEEGTLFRHHCECDRCLSRGGGSYFFYGPEAPTFQLPVIESTQKGRTVLVGMDDAREIDVCSFVPSIDETQSYQHLSEVLYNGNQNSWQRSLDRERQRMIARYWRHKQVINHDVNSVRQNHVVNNIVLSYSTDNHNVNEGSLSLDSWFSETCPSCNNTVRELFGGTCRR